MFSLPSASVRAFLRTAPASAVLLQLCVLWPAQTSGQSPIAFSDVTDTAKLREPLAGLMGHGGAWGDFDSDGRIDLFVGGFADRPDKEYAPASGPVPNRLFRNLGDGKFELVAQSEVETFARTSGAVFADLDNSGTLELYVSNNAKQNAGRTDVEPQAGAKTRRSQLFENRGGKLVEISKESGVCPESLLTARNIGVLDYDGDGLLDLFIVDLLPGPGLPRQTVVR